MGRPVCNSSGTIASVDTEASLEPVELLAVAWQVYATPFVNPETTIRVVLEDPEKILFPSLQNASYVESAAPPYPAMVRKRVISPSPDSLLTMTGVDRGLGGIHSSSASAK